MKKIRTRPLWFGCALILFGMAACLLRSSEKTGALHAHTIRLARTMPPRPVAAADSSYHVYISFDDGPLPGSQHIDSLVLAEKIPVSVFLVGHNLQRQPLMDQYYQLYKENPYVFIYNHSFSHAGGHYRRYYNQPAHVLADIIANQDTLGLSSRIVRMPGRNTWRMGTRYKDDMAGGGAAADLLAQSGYTLVGWDLEWQHDPITGVPIQSPAAMKNAILNKLKSGQTFTPNHIVLLLHDEMFRLPWEKDQLKTLIDSLRAQPGIVFDAIGSYPAK